MKYHSPISIIIISLIVLLLFVSVAFFAVFSIGLTSPTLIVAERVMEELKAAGGPLSFSFDSMDRNFRGGVSINGIEVDYQGESVVSLERVSIHMGIPALVRYLVLGDGRLEIEGVNGSISIPSSLISPEEGAAGDGTGFTLSHSVAIHLHDIDLSGFGAEALDTDISLYAEGENGGIRAEMLLPAVTYDDGKSSAAASNLVIQGVLRDSLTLSASGNSLSYSSDGIEFEAGFPVIRLSSADPSSLSKIEAAVSVSSLSGEAGGISFSTGRSSLLGTMDNAQLVFTEASVAYDEYSLSADEADISLSDGSVSAVLDHAEISRGELLLYSAARTEAQYDTVSSSFRLSVPMLFSDVLGFAGSDFTLRGESLVISGSAGEERYLNARGSITAVHEGAALNGTGGSFTLSLSTDEEGKINGNAAISDFYLPGMNENGYLFVDIMGDNASVQGAFGNRLVVSGEMNESGVRVSAFYTDLPLRPFIPLVSEYMPVLYNYIGEETAATGSISIDFDSDMNGPADFAIAISDIAFNDLAFSLAASGSGILREDGVDISQLSLTSDFIRASFDGSISYKTKLPEGRFVISVTDSGYELFVGTLTLESDEEYYFSAEIPYFSSSWLSGNVNWSEENVIESSATLKSGDYYYPFDIRVDLNENIITLDNENAHASVLLGEEVTGSISFSHFSLPVFRQEEIEPAYLNGTITAGFSFAEQQFSIYSSGFRVGNIGILSGSPNLDFSLSGDNSKLLFSNISFSSLSLPPMTGTLRIGYSEPSIAMSLSSSASERLLLSIVRSEDGMFSGLLRADDFNLGRFGIEDTIGDINLTARAGTWESLSFSGSIRTESNDMINNPSSAEADMYIDRDEIVFSSISYSSGNLSLGADRIGFSSETGILSADVYLHTALERADGMLPVSTTVSLEAALLPGSNLFESMRSMYQNGLSGASADIMIGETDLGGMFTLSERRVHAVNTGGRLDISGNLVSGSFDIDERRISADIDLSPVAVFSVDGNLSDGISLLFGIESFEISVADLFLNPSIVFYSPALARGEILAVKDGSAWNLSGWLTADEVAFDVFWMPEERVILHNPYFSVWNNSFQSLIDDCTVLNMETYERTPGRVALTIDLGPSLSMDGWTVDVYAEDGNQIGIRLPLPTSNIDIWGDVTGYLQVGQGSDSVLFLNGDLNASDLTMSIGMEPMPEWMLGSGSRTTADLSLLLTENVKFVFPLTGDPILRADLAEYQNLHVIVNEMGELEVSGSLDIRSGEIFYFQKNFYITEGNISFRQDLAESAGFNPIINLRARLRDFDSDGNQVDIYLILRDATMDNLSPSFESAPSKPLSEIMQILGQSILPNSVYGDISVSSMVSIVSASVDILSRFGIISSQNDSTLEHSIRSSLALDTFSLHTNIIENLIFDTVSYAASNLDNDALSPMARYLDGTTLYLGKYLSPELYLEGMIHLDAESNQIDRSHTFLADDLNLDIEVSLEWDNPLAVFTIFTQPENVTLYDIIDSLGFGVSKRIVW